MLATSVYPTDPLNLYLNKKKKPICEFVHVQDIKGCVPYPQPFPTFEFITLVDVMV